MQGKKNSSDENREKIFSAYFLFWENTTENTSTADELQENLGKCQTK